MRAATEIARFDADVQRARDAVQPLARQLVPSHEWPFVFFHLRKAGADVEDVVLRQNALDEVAYKFGDEMLTLRLAQGQSYLAAHGATAHKKGRSA